MKVFINSFAVILFLSNTLLFSQVNSNYDGPKPEVRAGSKSFVFRYTPFQSNMDPAYVSTVSVFNEDNMDLFGVGGRYFFTNEIAVTFALNFGTASSSQEFANGDKEDMSATTFGISADGNYHLKSLYSVSPYIGINLNFGSYSSTDELTEDGTTTKTEYSGSGFGAGINFGFDWYFTEGLSLGGKYTLGFRSLGKPDQKVGNTTVEGASSSFFGTGYASIILNVHF
ncbi:MAG: porin family protein [Ignavibacteriaceae bacterium]|nr:porin family protein [Ignavibacteriaceae bacterium]